MRDHDQEVPVMDDIRHAVIHDECVEYFNEPVLSHLEVVRLVGYGETAVDCYYILRGTRNGTFWASAVGGIMPLRFLRGQGIVSNGDEMWSDFARLDSWLALNGANKEDRFLLEIRHDDHEIWGADAGRERQDYSEGR